MFKNGDLLRELRRKKGFNQQEAAEAIGISFMTFRRWENGDVEPRISELQRIADVFEVSVDELLNGPRENIIEVTLRYEPDIKGGLIDMGTGNGYALTVADNGMVGISGAAIFKTRADLDKALNKIKAMLEEGFARQVEKGLASEE